MRLKQLLGVGLALPFLTPLALADSQLTDISVQSQENSAVVTIRANGSITHNEYRPADNLLLVDFPGAKVGALDSNAHAVSVPGITSYQVHSYKAANGNDIARVEFTLSPHATVKFAEQANALIVNVTTDANTVLPSKSQVLLSPAMLPESQQPMQAKIIPTRLSEPLRVRGISVVRGQEGTNVEIRANGLLSPKFLTLKSPDRLVIDLPNAVPEWNVRSIPVHAPDLNVVRMARYQADPPTTRVVLDLKAPQGFQLASMNDKLIVKLHPLSANATPVSAAPPANSAISNPFLKTASLKKSAQDYVVVEPEFHKVKPSETASVRATEAARILGAAPPVEIPLAGGSTAGVMKPEAMKAGMMQAAQSSAANTQLTNALASTQNCNTGRYTGEPISVNLKDVDLKDFFRLIHEISGLNVVLDPGVTGTLTIVLDDVPWDQALAIVLQNNSLQCQLSGNVLRIALPDTLRKEAEAVRATQEAQALAVDRVTVTRYLSYATAKNVVPTLKAFLSKRGDIIADDRTNSVIIQDIPTVIPGIDRLIKELDRKSQQVEIEARVVASTRNFARDLGAQVGFGWGNAPGAVGGASAVGTSPIQDAVPQAPQYFIVGTHQIPLFSNLGVTGPTSGLSFVNASNAYRIDVILTAAETRGLVKILSRPRVVTQNNTAALVRQGVRIPVVTAAQLGGPPTTSYVDAFLRLQVTPQITSEHTIFMNVDVENTTPNFSVQVAGNPELITQQATTQVLVTDGGTVVIGGVIQTQDTVNKDQVPFLGDVPILGNLFRRKSVSTSTQELIFFITPRILES
ncbi:MAG TPA: type IV pilus secretin PilQ [Terriglobales bacterium]|nr:type IV pilus secretin PilQ [Terriglobales bacterium]